MICCHWPAMLGEGVHRRADEDCDGRNLGRGGEQSGDRCRRAFVNVGRPHMEWHRRDLEAEAGEQKYQAEDKTDAGTTGSLPGGLRDAGKIDRAGETVDQRTAVKQHSRRQRAQHEVFQPGFGSPHGVALDGGEHVKAQAHQFETEIERDQIAGGYQQHHAEGREHHQDRIFEPSFARGRHVVERHQDSDGGSGQCQHLRETCEQIDDETAVEDDKLVARQPHHQGGNADQKQDGQGIDRPRRPVAGKGADHQQQHAAYRQRDFRQQRLQYD